MENSGQQNKIINLGKLLVNELGLTNSTDTLSRWMAHYLAEKISQLESLPSGEEKNEVEKVCFESILKLWEHRWLLPPGNRPFESFEPIFKVLEKINPDTDTHFYNRHQKILSKGKSELDFTEINQCLEMITQTDKVARIWIIYILERAVSNVKNEKIETFLENAINDPNDGDINIIMNFMDEEKAKLDKYRLETLFKRTEELKRFSSLNEFLLNEYTKAIESIQKGKSK